MSTHGAVNFAATLYAIQMRIKFLFKRNSMIIYNSTLIMRAYNYYFKFYKFVFPTFRRTCLDRVC